MEKSLSKEFEVNSSQLKEIRQFIRVFTKSSNLLKDCQEDIALAVTEACQNIIKHAYKDRLPTTDKIKIEINLSSKQIIINIFDRGISVVPKNIKPRKLDDVKPGGLGTFFIGQIMDEVNFVTNKKENWVNHLRLVKNI